MKKVRTVYMRVLSDSQNLRTRINKRISSPIESLHE